MAVAFIMSHGEAGDRADESLARLAGFPRELYFAFRLATARYCSRMSCQRSRC